jgi:hypothetical protein
MHAVEIADGDHRAPAALRNGRKARDHLHSSSFSGPCEVMDGGHDAGTGHGLEHLRLCRVEPLARIGQSFCNK